MRNSVASSEQNRYNFHGSIEDQTQTLRFYYNLRECDNWPPFEWSSRCNSHLFYDRKTMFDCLKTPKRRMLASQSRQCVEFCLMKVHQRCCITEQRSASLLLNHFRSNSNANELRNRKKNMSGALIIPY